MFGGIQLTPIVKNLLIINIFAYILQIVFGDFVTYNLALYDFRSEYFKPFQFFTYMWLHGDFFHILFNMFWLIFMGTLLERFLGDKRFLALYIISGMGAGLIQIGVNYYEVPDYATQFINIPTIGASGAISGVIMATAVLFPNTEMFILFIPFPIKLKYLVLFYIAKDLYEGLAHSNTGVAHFAHLGGMLFGFILIKIWNSQKNNFY